MLRSWPQGRRGTARAPLQLQLQQRQLWGRASDVLSWMGFGDSDPRSAADGVKSRGAPAAAARTGETAAPASTRWKAAANRSRSRSRSSDRNASGLPKGEWLATVRPSPPQISELPVACGSSDSTRQAARKTYITLSRFLRQTPDKTQLLSAWGLVSKCQPFVLDGDSVRLANATDLRAANALKPDEPTLLPMQMVPADIFAERTSGKLSRMLYVGSSSVTPEEKRGAKSVPVVAVNEAVVVAYMVEFLARMGAYEEAIEFYDAYTYDWCSWQKLKQEEVLLQAAMQPSTTSTASSPTEHQEQHGGMSFEKLTRLWRPARAGYFVSLAAIGGSRGSRIVELAEQSEDNLRLICGLAKPRIFLLTACVVPRKGALARRVVDVALDENPSQTLGIGHFSLAIKANLFHKRTGKKELQDALHVARRMQDDAGYVLSPELWDVIFRKCLWLRLPDLAFEVFQCLPRSEQLRYESQFRQILKAVLEKKRPKLTLKMVRHWLAVLDEGESEDDKLVALGLGTRPTSVAAVRGKNKAQVRVSRFSSSRSGEFQLLNHVLQCMLEEKHAVSSIKELLVIMETRGVIIDAKTLKKTVKVLLNHGASEASKLPPSKLVKNSLEFWENHRSTLRGSSSLMHLLLLECLERSWYAEGEQVVMHMVMQQVHNMPCSSIVELMAANEEIGQVKRNVRMAEKIVQKYLYHEVHPLSERFYECYLRNLLLLKRFDEMRRLYMDLKLATVFPESKTLPALLREARAF